MEIVLDEKLSAYYKEIEMENEYFSQLVWLFTQAPALAAFLLAVKAIRVMFSKNFSKKRVINYFTYAAACAAFWALLQLIINFVG